MTSISYAEIYSSFVMKIEGYDLFSPAMSEDMRNEFLSSFLHSTLSRDYVMRLFSSITDTPPYDEVIPATDEEEEHTVHHDGVIEYELNYELGEFQDKLFVQNILGTGMALAWLEPKINSIRNISQMIGTSDEKFYAQANHLSQLLVLKEDLTAELRGLIRDRGYAHNTYLDGTIEVVHS